MTDRLVSLDAFRGLTIAFMILVNTPGTGEFVYAPLRHARWEGWTPTDVVFPSFVWIVGVAVTLALGRRLEKGASRRELFLTAARRAAVLFGLGLLVYLYPHFDFGTMRVLGVLQRIAICYLATVGIYLMTGVRGQAAWIVGLMGSYWALMAWAPVPGMGAGRWDVEGNFAHYVDSVVLGVHNYAHTKTWDPEGVVSTLPAIATCLLGVMAGHVLARKQALSERTTWLFLTGNALLAGAMVLEHWMPVNKALWTDTFVLLMAGIDFVVFAGLVWLVDGVGVRKPFGPFLILGKNAIAVYMASELIDLTLQAIPWGGETLRTALYGGVFAPLAGPYNASLLYALAYVALHFGIAYGLHRRGWYLRA